MKASKLFIIAGAISALSLLSSCTNPYRDTMERTVPVLDKYESVLNGKQLDNAQKDAYLSECKATKMAINEALKTN